MVHYINRSEDKNHMNVSINTEKFLKKIDIHFVQYTQ